MRIRPHPYSGKRVAGEVVFEWADEQTLVLQVTARDIRPLPGEGISVHVDNSHGSLHVWGAVEIAAAVSMTEAEARRLHAYLGKVLET